jgi:hypothetical protein
MAGRRRLFRTGAARSNWPNPLPAWSAGRRRRQCAGGRRREREAKVEISECKSSSIALFVTLLIREPIRLRSFSTAGGRCNIGPPSKLAILLGRDLNFSLRIGGLGTEQPVLDHHRIVPYIVLDLAPPERESGEERSGLSVTAMSREPS